MGETKGAAPTRVPEMSQTVSIRRSVRCPWRQGCRTRQCPARPGHTANGQNGRHGHEKLDSYWWTENPHLNMTSRGSRIKIPAHNLRNQLENSTGSPARIFGQVSAEILATGVHERTSCNQNCSDPGQRLIQSFPT